MPVTPELIDEFFIGEDSGTQYRLVQPGEVLVYKGNDIPTHGLIATGKKYDRQEFDYPKISKKVYAYTVPPPPLPEILPGDYIVDRDSDFSYVYEDTKHELCKDPQKIFRNGKLLWSKYS